jgi:hypothetical protein
MERATGSTVPGSSGEVVAADTLAWFGHPFPPVPPEPAEVSRTELESPAECTPDVPLS